MSTLLICLITNTLLLSIVYNRKIESPNIIITIIAVSIVIFGTFLINVGIWYVVHLILSIPMNLNNPMLSTYCITAAFIVAGLLGGNNHE